MKISSSIQVNRIPQSKSDAQTLEEEEWEAQLQRAKRKRIRLTDKRLREIGMSDAEIKKFRKYQRRRKGVNCGSPSSGKRG